MTSRRWRRALWGRKSLKSFLHAEASPVTFANICHMHVNLSRAPMGEQQALPA